MISYPLDELAGALLYFLAEMRKFAAFRIV